MMMVEATPSEAISAIKSSGATPEARFGSDAAEFLRNTPSLNIVPFRHSRDTLNKAIMAMIVLAGGVMADENCLLRVVGDSSILSVSPHRGPLWTGSGSIGPFEPSAAHATLPDDTPPSAGCQTPAAPLDAPCSCPIHGSAPWHNQSGASHTGMDAPPWPSPMP